MQLSAVLFQVRVEAEALQAHPFRTLGNVGGGAIVNANKRTPAPWTLEEHEDEPCQLIGNGTIHIADIYMTDFPAGKADSLLIAAAPELLEAAESAFKLLLRLREREKVSDAPEIRALGAAIVYAKEGRRYAGGTLDSGGAR